MWQLRSVTNRPESLSSMAMYIIRMERFWENARGERIGFASNWRREPSELKITYSDGRVETRTLAPLETIEIKPKGERKVK